MSNRKSLPYVVRQGFTLYFRLVVPQDPRSLIRKRELKLSLKTDSLRQAERRGKVLSA
jgi:hypothetical protein